MWQYHKNGIFARDLMLIYNKSKQENMITVTDKAKETAVRMMQEEGHDGYFIRVGVEGGGCSGLMYQLTFDNQMNEDDKEFEHNGVKIVMNKRVCYTSPAQH